MGLWDDRFSRCYSIGLTTGVGLGLKRLDYHTQQGYNLANGLTNESK